MTILDAIGLTVIAAGVAFNWLGCLGMLRLPDVYNRLQAGTKCVTLGVCLILLGAAMMADGASFRIKAALCVAFILITSPTAAHALAGASRRSGIKLWQGSVVDQFESERPQ